jgi:glycosyltransferase involved in cell wall biosynthesis
MRILHAILSEGFYGSERYCIELASAQARAGHQVELLIADGTSDCARIFRHVVATTMAAASSGTPGRIGLTVIPKWVPAWLHRSVAGRVLGRFKPDLVHSHLNPAGRRVGRIAHARGIPHVATLHLDYEPREHSGCDGLIAVASWQRARIGPEFRGEAAVIWNWLPAAMSDALARTTPAERADLRRRWHADDATTVIGSIGRLMPAKGMDLLVRAFRLAFPHGNEPVRLAILGDGPLRGELARCAAGDDRIVLLEPQIEIAPLYRAFDVYVSAARFEPFGLTILEAMAAGLLLILTRTDGPREFVSDERATWIELEDEAGLAGALQGSVAGGARRISYDLARFTPQRALVEIDAFYRTVLGRSRQRSRNSEAR